MLYATSTLNWISMALQSTSATPPTPDLVLMGICLRPGLRPSPHDSSSRRGHQHCLVPFRLFYAINRAQEVAEPMVISYSMRWGDTYRSHPLHAHLLGVLCQLAGKRITVTHETMRVREGCRNGRKSFRIPVRQPPANGRMLSAFSVLHSPWRT